MSSQRPQVRAFNSSAFRVTAPGNWASMSSNTCGKTSRSGRWDWVELLSESIMKPWEETLHRITKIKAKDPFCRAANLFPPTESLHQARRWSFWCDLLQRGARCLPGCRWSSTSRFPSIGWEGRRVANISTLRCVPAGFPLNDQLYKLIVRRYSDEHGDMDFDNFVGCIVRLDSMISESALLTCPHHLQFLISPFSRCKRWKKYLRSDLKPCVSLIAYLPKSVWLM